MTVDIRPTVAVFVLVMSSAGVSAQWSALPNAPIPSSRINDVFFIDQLTGWIASGAGAIHKTTTGGATWVLQLQKAGTHFRSIGFADVNNGWAGCLGIGDPNNPSSTDTTILYRTTDGGFSWQPDAKVSGVIPRGFCGMHVVNDTVVYGVGRVRGPAYFYRTTDGGASWEIRNMSAFAGGLIDVRFFGVDTGFAVGLTNGDHVQSSGVVLRTTDRGTTWETMHTTARTGEWCWKLSFPSRETGYASLQRNSLSPIYFLKTTDGGVTWQEKLFSTGYYFVQGMGFVSDSVGWLGGNSTSPPYKTTDGGATWQASSIGRRVNRFRFISENVGFAAGETVYKYAPSQTSVAESDAAGLPPADLVGYPNPFNPTTTIRFTIRPDQTTSPVRLIIYDLQGREVERLVDDELEAGVYERTWHAAGRATGTYYYRLTVRGQSETKPIVLVR